jgi:4,5-DOPA dioxygenase extradiol
MPTLFVSHGSPMLAVEDSAARRFLVDLGRRVPRPSAAVVFSAHYDARRTEITGAAEPPTIHDFGGFPPELYEIRYAAPGAPRLAERIASLLEAASLDAAVEPRRGLDHGAWIPLSLLFPDAGVPALEVSINSARAPEAHFELGRALRPLRDEGVLLLGSGGATHNLGLYFQAGGRDDSSPPLPFVAEFNEWVAGAIGAGRYDDLARYRALAPHAAQNHPTPEHFLPLFATLGAAHDDERGRRIHSSYDRGLLSLDAYAFGFDDAAAARSRESRGTASAAN